MFFMRQTIIVMSRHIEFDQKNEIFQHYQQLDTQFYKENTTGDLMNRMAEDVSRVRMYTGPAVMYLINLVALIGFCVVSMLRKDAMLTFYVLAPLPILAITIYLENSVINKKSEKIQAFTQHCSSIHCSARTKYQRCGVWKRRSNQRHDNAGNKRDHRHVHSRSRNVRHRPAWRLLGRAPVRL